MVDLCDLGRIDCGNVTRLGAYMVHGRVAADPMALFLRKHTFHCKALVANLTPEECAGRQLREVEMKMFGRRILTNDAAPDRYCRSGCCQQGLIFLRRLNYKAWLSRLKARRESKAPCRTFGKDRDSNTASGGTAPI